MKLGWVTVLALMVAAARSADARPVGIATGGDLPADLVVDAERGVLRSGDVEVSLRDLLIQDPGNPDDGVDLGRLEPIHFLPGIQPVPHHDQPHFHVGQIEDLLVLPGEAVEPGHVPALSGLCREG